jgi:hypothetical protein
MLEFNHKLLNIISHLNNSSNINLKLNRFSNLINKLLCKHLPFTLNQLRYNPLSTHNQPRYNPLSTHNNPKSTTNNPQLLFMCRILKSNLNLFMLSQLLSIPNLPPSILNLRLFNIMSHNLNIINQNLLSKLIKVSDLHMQMKMSELDIQELF